MKEKYKLRNRIFPELERFDNDQERTQVLKHCSRKATLNWKWICVLLAMTALCAVASIVLKEQIDRVSMLPSWINIVLSGSIMGGLIGRGFQWFVRNPIRKYLRDELVARGMPICLHCGYDLRGQTKPRCPECGEAFDERLLFESRT